MISPVPSIADDQLSDVMVKRRADQMLIAHEQYSRSIHAIRQRDIERLEALVVDLLNIIETGMPNHCATAAARRIASRRMLA